ncbi:hypothetical protein AMAG_01170 [Allomyces macrogynus ATCC 38327]|uniref:Uncharacterized protein n=1 Tax=Allomyces macrogynus (strain ATCC 38327) TaxID=578462 RepID=A0A0L0RXY5_ALLM3|nr:hypothetical protein AMAG_01170 [Allomyces macrogynus ATCC 38327]|eukprot:KNE55257.1 hypothetical protein AMAG_01170 [Allomyces macrogynus ATCC 38327]
MRAQCKRSRDPRLPRTAARSLAPFSLPRGELFLSPPRQRPRSRSSGLPSRSRAPLALPAAMFAALLRQDSALDSPAKHAAAAKPPPPPAARRRASAADLRASGGGGAASPVPTTPAGSPYSVPLMMMMPPSPSPYSHSYPAYVPSPLHSSAASVTSSASSSSTASSSASSAPSVGAMAGAIAAPPLHHLHHSSPQVAPRSSTPAPATPSETPTATRWSSWTSLAAWNPFAGGSALKSPAAPNLATARAPTAAPPTAASAAAPMPAAAPAWAATTPMHPHGGHGAATQPAPPTPVIYAYQSPPDVQHHLATAPPPPGTPVLMHVLMSVPAGAPGSPPTPHVPFSYYAPAGYPAGYATPTTAPGTPSAAAPVPPADLMARVAAAAAAAGQPSMPTGPLPTNYLLSIASVTVAFLQPFVHYANRHQDVRRAQTARSSAATPVGVMTPMGALATTSSANPPTVPARRGTTPAPVLVSSFVVAAVLAVFLVPAVLTAITVSWTRFGRQHVLRELREAALVAHVRWATGEMRPIAMPMAHALQFCAAIIDRAPYLALPANRRFLAALVAGRPTVRARLRPAQQLLASGMLKSRAATAAVAEALGVWARWALLTIVSLMAASDAAVPVPVSASSARVAPTAGDGVEGSSATTARRSPGSPRKRRSMVRS